MVEKYLKKNITRTDLEDYILNYSLEHEYAKPHSGKEFTINPAVDQGKITPQDSLSVPPAEIRRRYGYGR